MLLKPLPKRRTKPPRPAKTPQGKLLKPPRKQSMLPRRRPKKPLMPRKRPSTRLRKKWKALPLRQHPLQHLLHLLRHLLPPLQHLPHLLRPHNHLARAHRPMLYHGPAFVRGRAFFLARRNSYDCQTGGEHRLPACAGQPSSRLRYNLFFDQMNTPTSPTRLLEVRHPVLDEGGR